MHRVFLRVVFLLGGLLLLLPAHAQFFTDVNPDDPDIESFQEVIMSQLMEGFPDGSFAPDIPVRRADTIMVMARLMNISLRGFMIMPGERVENPTVTGIASNHWAYRAAHFLAEYGMLHLADDGATPLTGQLTRGELLDDLSRLQHQGVAEATEVTARELIKKGLVPEEWAGDFRASVTRRELARALDTLLFYLTQHAITEGTIIAFETDETGNRWVHLETKIGEARLYLPKRSVVILGGDDEALREGVTIRTLSDAVSVAHGSPYYRVREVTVLPEKG